jgi:hypothetical protein
MAGHDGVLGGIGLGAECCTLPAPPIKEVMIQSSEEQGMSESVILGIILRDSLGEIVGPKTESIMRSAPQVRPSPMDALRTWLVPSRQVNQPDLQISTHPRQNPAESSSSIAIA